MRSNLSFTTDNFTGKTNKINDAYSNNTSIFAESSSRQKGKDNRDNYGSSVDGAAFIAAPTSQTMDDGCCGSSDTCCSCNCDAICQCCRDCGDGACKVGSCVVDCLAKCLPSCCECIGATFSSCND